MSNPGLLSYDVAVDGTLLADSILVQSIRVRRSTGAASHAQLCIDMSNDADVSAFKVASAVTVSMGWDAQNTDVFTGDIIGLSVNARLGQKQLVVDAYDKSYRLGQSVTRKSFVNASVSDALKELAGGVSLTGDIDSVLTTPVYDYLPVVGTVHQFISDVAAGAGCEWLVDGSKLIVRKRNDAAAPALTFDLGVDIESYDLRYTASTQTDGVTVRGWDSAAQRAVVGSASAARLANNAPVTNNNDNTVAADRAVIWPRTVFDSNDAQALAEGAKARVDAEALTGRVRVVLSPTLVPGQRVKINGIDDAWNGDYYVTAVEHTVDSGAGSTRFTVGGLEPGSLVDLLGRADQPSVETMYSGVTIGIVTNLDDPDGLSRVKVKLPYIGDDHETDFARVLQPGAGLERGFQFLPEKDDEVLVAFEHGDRRLPIVLGGLWSSNVKPPPNGVVDGQVERRALTSRLGHELLLLDGTSEDTQLVSITTAGQNATLVLAEDKITLTSEDKPITLTNGQSTITMDGGDIKIEATNITITAKNGDVKMAGQNIEAKSDMNVKAQAGVNLELKGGTTAKLEGTASTAIKGGMVQIN